MGGRGKRLTSKRKAFVEAVASGDAPTLTEAYREAFDAEGSSPRTAKNEASRLARDPYIAPAIEERRAQIDASSGAAQAGGRRYVLRRLREEADNLDSRASERISALALLAKASGALDQGSPEERRASSTESDLIAELEARLEAYIEAPLDVSPGALEAPRSDEPD